MQQQEDTCSWAMLLLLLSEASFDGLSHGQLHLSQPTVG